MLKFFLLFVFASIAFAASLDKTVLKSTHSGRIYGGEIAERNQYPFSVVLLVIEENDDFLCGGSIISNKFILTTAKCVYQSIFLRASIGVYDYVDDEDRIDILYSDEEIQQYFIVHEGFDPKSLRNNIALMRLKEDVEFSEKIQMIPLSAASMGPESLVDLTLTIIGWGFAAENDFEIEYPRHANVTVLPSALCSHYYSSQDKLTTFCSDGEFEKGACTMDEGGAAIMSDGNSRLLVGLISFYGPIGCNSGWPTSYVSVAKYVDWIIQHSNLAQN